jgi:hypothetical protein
MMIPPGSAPTRAIAIPNMVVEVVGVPQLGTENGSTIVDPERVEGVKSKKEVTVPETGDPTKMKHVKQKDMSMKMLSFLLLRM